jgi:DNA polymerase
MTRPTITLDFETRSYADLKKVGAWAYSEHPSTEVICAAWGDDEGDTCTWSPLLADDDFWLKLLYRQIEDGALIEAHNCAFEYSIWRNIMMPRFGAPAIPDENWRDTMAVAAYYALPMQLDRLAFALGYEGKDPAGARLISKYSKLHLKTAKLDIPPDDLEAFIRYCIKDVEIEQSISDELGPLPDRELEIFHLDQRINKRGLLLDVEGIAIAGTIVDQVAGDLAASFRELTTCAEFPKGLSPNQAAKIIEWAGLYQFKLSNLQKNTIKDLLEEEDEEGAYVLPDGPVRRALELRADFAKASTKKLDAMINNAGADQRARFQTRYHGAATGRQTGTGFQPLNLNKGFEDLPPEQLVRDIGYGDARWLKTLYGSPMDAIGKASRHWIKAAPGWKIISGDFVSIEAVVLACTAYEDWKIEAFRLGHPIYALMGTTIHGIPESEALMLGDEGFKAKYPKERFDGKTGELAFGYQGALGAWRKFDRSNTHTDARVIEICKAWRRKHEATCNYWREMEYAAHRAVQHPGREVWCNEVSYKVIDEWLSMRLPDGKRIWYREPQMRLGWPQWHKPEFDEDGEPNDCAAGTCDCEKVPKLYYKTQKTGRWQTVSTYGGKLTENATQAISRQILFPAMLAIDAAWGAPLRAKGLIKPWESVITLSVYDEIVCEVPEDFATGDDFRRIVLDAVQSLAWAEGWPISVDVWEGERYKK